MTKFTYEDVGLKDYKDCWDYQESILEEIQATKKATGAPTDLNRFLLVEHPHVYTLGKSGDEHNLLVHDDFLKKIEATYYKIRNNFV